MPQVLLLALMAAPFMVVLDLVWIGLIANNYYREQLGSLFTTHILVVPAILFYLIYLFALAYFAIAPAIAVHSFWKVVINAALLGLVAYATYDLTNLSTTAGWPLQMTFVDMAWGIVVSTVASSSAYLIATKVFGF